MNTLQVDFKKTRRAKREHQGSGVYTEARADGKKSFYENVRVNGRLTWRRLPARTLNQAISAREARRVDRERARLGLARSPEAPAEKSLEALCELYLKLGCPRKNVTQTRAGQLLREEESRVRKLAAWPAARRLARELSLEDVTDYYRWRKPQFRGHGNKGGDRQITKELRTLSNVYRTAVRHVSRTGVTANPFGHDLPNFRDPAEVTHCRDHMPASGEEVHTIARYLFNVESSQVLGWFALIQAIAGQRAHEVARLRVDAAAKGEAGFISGRRLYLFRSRTSKGTFGHVDLRQEELDCLEAHRAWLRRVAPESPWFFPSPEDPAQPVAPRALTDRLRRACRALGLPHRTSHGLRAFRVNVLRSRGMADGEIAIRIGQKSQGKLIVPVYGEGLDHELTFMPESGKPAWDAFRPAGALDAKWAAWHQDIAEVGNLHPTPGEPFALV